MIIDDVIAGTYKNNSYYKDINASYTLFKYICLTVNKISPSNTRGVLLFSQFKIYGNQLCLQNSMVV